MTNLKTKQVLFTFVVGICLAAVWFACSTRHGPRFITTLDLSSALDLNELTPVETKRLEHIVNSEVSPCGDDVTLAESLFNQEHCPLAVFAGKFVMGKIMDDYNVEEVSKAYVARYAAIKGLEIPIDGSPKTGADKPIVTIVVFTDFECPYCARAASVIHEIMRRYPEEILVVYKHFPLASHPMADTAARAVFAAYQQDKFWEMHDTLFSAIGSQLSQERIETMAIGIGLDLEKFKESQSSNAATASIAADKKLAEELQVTGTPTVFVNGRVLKEGTKEIDDRIREAFLLKSHK